MSDWEFIATEFVGSNGEEGERFIWEAVVKALKGNGEGIAILNYSDYHHNEQKRYQPDILLVSREWGLIVIEVKSCRIDQIRNIRANQWEMQGFYSHKICPLKQAENQLWQILKRCDHEQALNDRVPGRALVALPLITREEWRDRGFEDDHHTCPPIIFGNELGRRTLFNSLEHGAVILDRGDSRFKLNDQQWELLKRVILGHPKVPMLPKTTSSVTPFPSSKTSTTAALRRPKYVATIPIRETEGVGKFSETSEEVALVPSSPRRIEALAALRGWMSEIDIQQAKIGMQIPPGPQRIRGIAGSGKTLLLCQKAARMHIQHPDWDIVLVFFTRSLYQLLPDLVRQWVEYWSDGTITPDFEHGKLKVLHAWGSKGKPGFYSQLRDHAGMNALVTEKPVGSIPELLAASCRRLLDNAHIEPMYDAILIDEGQDLAVNNEWKYKDKQAFYWLAWQALRPVSPEKPEQKRLIWAYDEAQSLDSLEVPSYSGVFGAELGNLLSGAKTGPIYQGGINKNEVMKRCYRTPGPVLVAAHAIGMGLLRKQGMLSGFTRKEDWERIGYTVKGNFMPGNRVTLHRPLDNSPNPIPQLWGRNPLEFEVYSDRESQVQTLVEKIKRNVEHDGLQLSRDILVIVLGADQDAQGQEQTSRGKQLNPGSQLQRQVVNSLRMHGIPYYMPGAEKPNLYSENSFNRGADVFWWDEAITVSRMYRAKGHEAPMVYVLGLEHVAQDESNVSLRNQLFVALTRSTAWVHLSGIQDPDTCSDYLLYDEIREVIDSGDTLSFFYRKPPKRALEDNE